ncbi:MAG: small protein A [Halothiobacillaceae bacterium]|nr:MAG: small protein A [Halothiobacillaceae bacterium]
MRMRKLLIYPTLLASFSLAGCAIHRVDVQQGNIVNPEARAKLQTGMTREQVIFLLGTPLIKDPFHKDRWDYVFRLLTESEVKQQKLTLLFRDDKVTQIDEEPMVVSPRP